MNSDSQRPGIVFPCDQCLQRKVRCDKTLPQCKRCSDSSLNCTREVVRKRPGRKKGSGTVISKLRNDPEESLDDSQGIQSARQDESSAVKSPTPSQETLNVRPAAASSTSLSEVLKHKRTLNGDSPRSVRDTPALLYATSTSTTSESASQTERSHVASPLKHDEYFSAPYRTPTRTPTPYGSPVDVAIFERPAAFLSELMPDIDQFFSNLYPIWPIIDHEAFRGWLQHPEQIDRSKACLIFGICALSALHIPEQSAEPRKARAQRFIKQALQLRSSYEYIENATLVTVQTSLLLSVAEVEVQMVRSSWFLLREAIMLAQDLGYYEPATLTKLTASESLGIQRTLYSLSLTERGLTLLRNKPFAIIMFESPPDAKFENEDPRVLYGLQSLSKLFNLLDKHFLDTWMTGSPATSLPETRTRIINAQHILARLRFDLDNLTDIQKADLLIAQQWLRLVFWQLSMRQGLLSSASTDPHLTYQFPCVVAKSLCIALEQISMAAVFLHGMAIFERIFEITYSFIDSLCLSQSLSSGLEELRMLFGVLRESPNSHDTYIKILEKKLIEQAGDGGHGIIPQIHQLTAMQS